jgi:hypothetical protein
MTTIYARRRWIESVYAKQPKAEIRNEYAPPTEHEWGAYLRQCGVSWMDSMTLWHDARCTRHDKSKLKEFISGWHSGKPVVHFVGMRDERQYLAAVRVWGKPDYDWPNATFRIIGECAPGDTVIYGSSAFIRPKRWAAI